MVGSVDLDGWARSLVVTTDDDAIGVVEELRFRVSMIESTAARLQTKLSDCPGDIGTALSRVMSLLEDAEGELIEVRAGFARHERGNR